MFWKFAVLLAATTQIRAQGITTTTTRTVKTVTKQVSKSSASNNAVTTNTIILPVQELQLAQSNLEQKLQEQTAALQQAQTLFNQQIAGWSFSSPNLRSTFEKSLSSISDLFDQSNKYIQGGEKLLAALQATGGNGIQTTWIDGVRKLQGLAELSLMRASESVLSISRSINDFGKDQEIYGAAKQKQLVETKAQMDATLNNLMKQTVQVGMQASEKMQQGIKEWSTLIRQNMAPDAAQVAINKMQQMTQRTLGDLSKLRPEDIEMAMSHAHHCIDDIKGLLYSSGIPTNLVRQAVNSVQLSVFAFLTKSRNLHL